MSYGIQPTTEPVYFGSSQGDNPNQLDWRIFTDLNQQNIPSTAIPTEGGNFYCATSAGGSITNNSTTLFTGIGVTLCSGVISISSGGTNNSTGYATMQTNAFAIPGIPIPAAGQVTKYEFETLIKTGTVIHSDTVRGVFRLGFFDNTGFTVPGDSTGIGPHFKFLCDGTTTHTTWNVYFGDANVNFATVDTGVTVSTSTLYRMYLSVEVNSDSKYTTTYKIKNLTTGTTTEGTAAPPSSSYYPGAGYGINAMGAGIFNGKSNVTATITPVPITVDYMFVRIRRPMSREILIFS
jgi:hypothetical protein